MDEFNTKEFKRQVERAKTCRELIEVLKVSVSLVDVTVHGGMWERGCVVMILMTSRNDKSSTNSTQL